MTRREKFFATNLILLVLVSALIGAVDSLYVATGLLGAGSVFLLIVTFVRGGGIQESNATTEEEKYDGRDTERGIEGVDHAAV
jgi:hypothetical protein